MAESFLVAAWDSENVGSKENAFIDGLNGTKSQRDQLRGVLNTVQYDGDNEGVPYDALSSIDDGTLDNILDYVDDIGFKEVVRAGIVGLKAQATRRLARGRRRGKGGSGAVAPPAAVAAPAKDTETRIASLEADLCQPPFQVTQALVISAEDGCPLKEHEWYIVVPWMRSIREVFRRTLINILHDRNSSGTFTYTNDELDSLMAEEANTAWPQQEKFKELMAAALAAHSIAIGGRHTPVSFYIFLENELVQTQGADPAKTYKATQLIGWFDKLATEACFPSMAVGAAIGFYRSMVGRCAQSMPRQLDREAHYDVSPFASIVDRETMDWALDEDMLVVAKHAHRSTTRQLRALGDLAAELQNPATQALDRVASDIVVEHAQVLTKMTTMMTVSAKIGDKHASLPQSLCIRLCDLRPNRNVKEHLECMKNVFGVDIKFNNSGKAGDSRLLDAGKFNGLLAWTASYCVTLGYLQHNQWMSATFASEGNDAEYFLPNMKEAFVAHVGRHDADHFTPRRRMMGSGMSQQEFINTAQTCMECMLDGTGGAVSKKEKTAARLNLERMGGMHMIGFLYRCWGAHTLRFGCGKNAEANATFLTALFKLKGGGRSPFNDYRRYDVRTAAVSFRDACGRLDFAKKLLDKAMACITNTARVDDRTKNLLLQPELCRWVVSKILHYFASAARLKAGGSYMAIRSIIAMPRSTDFFSSLLTDTEAMVAMYDDANINLVGIDTNDQGSVLTGKLGTGRGGRATMRRLMQYSMSGLIHNWDAMEALRATQPYSDMAWKDDTIVPVKDQAYIGWFTNASISCLAFCLQRCTYYLNTGGYVDDPAGWLAMHHSKHSADTNPGSVATGVKQTVWTARLFASMSAEVENAEVENDATVPPVAKAIARGSGGGEDDDEHMHFLSMALSVASLLLSPKQSLVLLKNDAFRTTRRMRPDQTAAVASGDATASATTTNVLLAFVALNTEVNNANTVSWKEHVTNVEKVDAMDTKPDAEKWMSEDTKLKKKAADILWATNKLRGAAAEASRAITTRNAQDNGHQSEFEFLGAVYNVTQTSAEFTNAVNRLLDKKEGANAETKFREAANERLAVNAWTKLEDRVKKAKRLLNDDMTSMKANDNAMQA